MGAWQENSRACKHWIEGAGVRLESRGAWLSSGGKVEVERGGRLVGGGQQDGQSEGGSSTPLHGGSSKPQSPPLQQWKTWRLEGSGSYAYGEVFRRAGPPTRSVCPPLSPKGLAVCSPRPPLDCTSSKECWPGPPRHLLECVGLVRCRHRCRSLTPPRCQTQPRAKGPPQRRCKYSGFQNICFEIAGFCFQCLLWKLVVQLQIFCSRCNF